MHSQPTEQATSAKNFGGFVEPGDSNGGFPKLGVPTINGESNGKENGK